MNAHIILWAYSGVHPVDFKIEKFTTGIVLDKSAIMFRFKYLRHIRPAPSL